LYASPLTAYVQRFLDMDKRREGFLGEEKAVQSLKEKGYRILERNYTNRFGEIDIIAEEQGSLVFVEVKKRASGRFGGPFSAIDKRKKDHLIKTALGYLKENKACNKRARFDVVGIEGDRLQIIKNAFLLGEDGR
jgi:putative endonuclease